MSDGGPQEVAAASPPENVWATVRIDGERICRVEVERDETMTIEFEAKHE